LALRVLDLVDRNDLVCEIVASKIIEIGTNGIHDPREIAEAAVDRLEQRSAIGSVKALIVANTFLETELEKLRAAVSPGYARGKLFEETKTLPRDRKDWYD
jgi:hypothetical protein